MCFVGLFLSRRATPSLGLWPTGQLWLALIYIWTDCLWVWHPGVGGHSKAVLWLWVTLKFYYSDSFVCNCLFHQHSDCWWLSLHAPSAYIYICHVQDNETKLSTLIFSGFSFMRPQFFAFHTVLFRETTEPAIVNCRRNWSCECM